MRSIMRRWGLAGICATFVAGNAMATDALETARLRVAQIGMQGGGKCSTCHTASLPQATNWSKQAGRVHYKCVVDPSDPTKILTPREKVDCLRSIPGDVTSPFSAARLGFYSLATRTETFAKLFRDAYPQNPAEGQAVYAQFVAQASMPPAASAAQPFEPALAGEIAKWAIDGMPLVSAVIKPDPERPCQPFLGAELTTHLNAMRTTGWSAKNRELGMASFGCGAATSALNCLTTLPDESGQFGAPATTQKIRRLIDRPIISHYWFRTSADGRYLGFGGGDFGTTDDAGKIIDLVKAAQPGVNSVGSFDDATDPYFFPDNSGFVFTGLKRPFQSACKLSVIAEAIASPGAKLKLMDNAKCRSTTEGWYESWGASLDGSGYWVVSGGYIADDAQYDANRPIPASSVWKADTLKLNELVNDGLSFKDGRSAAMGVSQVVDAIVSPSAKIINNRFGANGLQSGYEIRSVRPQWTDDGGSLHFPKIGEVCQFGGKAAFSYDERFLTFHQYPEPWRPGAPNLPSDTANIVVLDLLSGASTRITQMPAGFKALYPNFRSDGWLYFLIRDVAGQRESIVASDFAIRALATSSSKPLLPQKP